MNVWLILQNMKNAKLIATNIIICPTDFCKRVQLVKVRCTDSLDIFQIKRRQDLI